MPRFYLKLSEYEVQLLIPVIEAAIKNIQNHCQYLYGFRSSDDVITDEDYMRCMVDNNDPVAVDYCRLLDLLICFNDFLNHK